MVPSESKEPIIGTKGSKNVAPSDGNGSWLPLSIIEALDFMKILKLNKILGSADDDT